MGNGGKRERKRRRIRNERYFIEEHDTSFLFQLLMSLFLYLTLSFCLILYFLSLTFVVTSYFRFLYIDKFTSQNLVSLCPPFYCSLRPRSSPVSPSSSPSLCLSTLSLPRPFSLFQASLLITFETPGDQIFTSARI